MKYLRQTLTCLVLATMTMLQCPWAKSASDGSLQIETVRKKSARYNSIADQYLEFANRLRKRSDDLAAITKVDYKERECEVLADLLALGDDVVVDSVQEDPGIGSSDGRSLQLYALSLKNYAIAAEVLLSRDEFSLKYIWNLNCSEKYNSFDYFEQSEPTPYRIHTSADGTELVIIGDIRSEMYERVADVLRGNATVKSVKILSRGGYIGEAMKIGRLIRSLELDTILVSECYSSCTLIFIAGTKRIVPPPFYSLGFHRISQFDKELDDRHPNYGAIVKYADDMIGSGEQIVRYWQLGSGEYFFRPDRKTLCGTRIATDVVGVCAAD